MKNNSKKLLKEKGITYKELSILLNISERQAMNILNKENKGLINYLIISYISGYKINEMFELETEEKEKIKKRIELINSIR